MVQGALLTIDSLRALSGLDHGVGHLPLPPHSPVPSSRLPWPSSAGAPPLVVVVVTPLHLAADLARRERGVRRRSGCRVDIGIGGIRGQRVHQPGPAGAFEQKGTVSLWKSA